METEEVPGEAPPEDKIKQVIVMRKDLGMRAGKMIAQGAHASMLCLLDGIQGLKRSPAGLEYGTIVLTPTEAHWASGRFTKVCVRVESEEELLAIHAAATEADVYAGLITDSGLTEFHGVPTKTCLALGPDYSSKIDPDLRSPEASLMSTWGEWKDELFAIEFTRKKSWEDIQPKTKDPWTWNLRITLLTLVIEFEWRRNARLFLPPRRFFDITKWKRHYWGVHLWNKSIGLWSPLGRFEIDVDREWLHQDHGDSDRNEMPPWRKHPSWCKKLFHLR